jgi:hypothetical protein
MLEETARLHWGRNERNKASDCLTEAHQLFISYGATGHAARLQLKHPELAA